uniref:Dentin sialophosphoprotein-like n=1 Tax=Panagrolaimus sp. ES5 TaxID=591445 RepID=A0AC34F1J1_9BILA
MSNPQPINNERTPQWQSGPPDSVPVKTSDVLGHDLDKDNNEDTQPKVKTVENQSPVENSQRKQENSGENEKDGGGFEHESHDFHKHSSPSHFTGGEKSELEKKDDEATKELIHPPKENKEKTYHPKDDNKNTTTSENEDNKDHQTIAENVQKTGGDIDASKGDTIGSKNVNLDLKSNKTNEKSTFKASVKDDNVFDQPKTTAKDPNPQDKNSSKNSLTSNQSKEVRETGKDIENSEANISSSKDVWYDAKTEDTNEKSSAPSTETSYKGKGQQETDKRVKIQCSSDSEDGASEESERKKDSSKYQSKTTDTTQGNNQTLADRVRDFGVDIDASKANTFGSKDVGSESKKEDIDRKTSSPSPKQDTKNDKTSEKREAAMQSDSKTQQRDDSTSSTDDSDQESDANNKNKEDKEVQPKSQERNDNTKIAENSESETLADRVRDFGVDIDASKSNTFGPKDFGFLKDDKSNVEIPQDSNLKDKKSADSENQNNESSIQNNEIVGKEEDKNSIKQWVENLVTNDNPESPETSNDIKSRDAQDKRSTEN